MTASFDYGVYYREVNESTDEYASSMANGVVSSLGRWLPENRNVDVLDIGCGMGFAMLGLQSVGYRTVKGVDIDRSQIEACQQRGLDVELIGELNDYLSLARNRFGLVVMLDVLEHIPVAQQISTLSHILDSLKPGGRLIIRVPNASAIIAPRWQYQDFTHHSSFTELSIKFAAINAGFSRVEVPYEDNLEPRPSFRPGKLFSKDNRTQFKRFIIRRLWRQVMLVEMGEKRGLTIPLGLNLLAIADKAL